MNRTCFYVVWCPSFGEQILTYGSQMRSLSCLSLSLISCFISPCTFLHILFSRVQVLPFLESAPLCAVETLQGTKLFNDYLICASHLPRRTGCSHQSYPLSPSNPKRMQAHRSLHLSICQPIRLVKEALRTVTAISTGSAGWQAGKHCKAATIPLPRSPSHKQG